MPTWPPANLIISTILLMQIIFMATVSLTPASKSGQLGPMTNCSMSEFTCINGKCVQLNKFCDKINDCGDNSDEPRFCTSTFTHFLEIYIKFHWKPRIELTGASFKTPTTNFRQGLNIFYKYINVAGVAEPTPLCNRVSDACETPPLGRPPQTWALIYILYTCVLVLQRWM